MTAVVLATNVTVTGPTTGVAVAASNVYAYQITRTGSTGGATVTLEVSVDGTNYFALTSGQETATNAGGQDAGRIINTPVQKMRLNITNYVTGCSVSGTVVNV